MHPNIPSTKKKRILIIGGGFGGLKLAETISDKHYQIVLIDKNNYHQFQPLIYQVATAGLEPSSIAFPFRKIFQKKNDVHFRMANLEKIDADNNQIETSIGKIQYDFLVIATGVDTNFYGNRNIAQYSLPMKSVADALRIRNAIFSNIEDSITASSVSEKKTKLNIVIAGGGPTGVEVAGTLAEIKKFVLPKDYPEMDFKQMKIYLVEGSDRLLSSMSEVSSKKAREYLNKMGVTVLLNSIVSDFDDNVVSLKNGDKIPTKTLIWAAGIIGYKFRGIPKSAYVNNNRILVDEFNLVKNTLNIYAIGDAAQMVSESYPNGHPQMAQAAIQQAINLGKNFNRFHDSKTMFAFEYKNLGSMATVGKNKAVVELPNYKFHGFFAWIVWMVVHLRSILGIKNRFVIFLNWVWNYMTNNLSLRLIISSKPSKKFKEEEE